MKTNLLMKMTLHDHVCNERHVGDRGNYMSEVLAGQDNTNSKQNHYFGDRSIGRASKVF